MATSPIIYWLRQDLRVADNPALYAALASGQPVLAVYILDETPTIRPLGGASRWWLHQSLTALAQQLPLHYRRGPALAVLQDLIKQTGATSVVWSRCYEPQAIARDKHIKATLEAEGIKVHSYNSALLHEPWQVQSKTGGPYRVFTPYWKACLAQLQAPARPAVLSPSRNQFIIPLASDELTSWQLLPQSPDWAGGLRASWTPGEAGAQQQLHGFMSGAIEGYKDGRNHPGTRTTSRLSAHLHFGEISPWQIWQAVQDLPQQNRDSDHFLSELGWREFAYHLLYHYPSLPTAPLNPAFTNFPWVEDAAALRQWQRGQTGYPIIDAGMRELWQTGWMHNRVRMITASFLVKDLLLNWQEGESWFWDTLVDADLANNVAGWQWVAGCGADAAPYFRVFNPILQGEKFDADGAYVRRYVPELARLPDKWLHRPFEAPANVLQAAGVELGKTYPLPLVDHAIARERALAAFAQIKAT